MTRADAVALEALADRLERKMEKRVRKGHRSDSPKVKRARGEVDAIRRALRASNCTVCGSQMRAVSTRCSQCEPDRAGG